MENLDSALENAKQWCKNNLQKYILNTENVDYSIFRYNIDDYVTICDMWFKDTGLIYVSTKKIKELRKIERRLAKDKYRPREPVEVDEESMFVHEIAEFLLSFRPEMLKNLDDFWTAHNKAREIENINRKERGLKDWPEY